MDKLTESQFHTVWTEAVGMEGYNKRLFQNLLESLQDKGLISEKSEYETCLNIARGCHDYNGGHHQKDMYEAYHHGISTVIRCLEMLGEKGLNDLQLSVVHNIGKKVTNG